jgi:hypothetical protein
VTARAWAAPAACALVYTFITAILGREVLGQLGTAIANDPGDPLLIAAILDWNAHHIPWTEGWWQFPIYYPTADTLAFSEHLLGVSVIASPIIWLTGSPLIAYNLTLLLTFPLCGLAMYALVHRVTSSHAASFIAGLAYAFAPYRMSNLPHLQMLASFWAPLALLGLHGFLDAVRVGGRRRWMWLALYGGAWALQAAANGYMLVFFSVVVALWVLWFVVARRMWRDLGLIAAATAVAALPLLPIVYKYSVVHASHGFERSLGEMRIYSADVAGVLCAPPALTFWGWLRVACRGEGELFPGLALALLAAAALVYALQGKPARPVVWIQRALLVVAGAYALIVASILLAGPWTLGAGPVRISASDVDKPLLVAIFAAIAALVLGLGARIRQPRSMLVFYLLAAIVSWLLALGPTITLMGETSGRPGPFAWLEVLPGVDGLRVPARFWLMTLLCLSTAAGMFIAEAVLWGRRRAVAGGAVLLLIGLVLADGWTAPIAAVPVPAPVADPSLLRNRVVLHVPMDQYTDIATTWRAATGGWRSVNGYSGYEPNYYSAAAQASRSGSDVVFAPFRRDGDLYVVVTDQTHPIAAAVKRQPGVVAISGGATGSLYRLPRRDTSAAVPAGRPLAAAGVRSRCAEGDLPRAIDGDARTVWLCRMREAQELTIDLGVTADVAGIDYAIGPSNQIFPDELIVETSSDGGAWAAGWRGTILGGVIAEGLRDPQAVRVSLPFAARPARYVRIRPVATAPDFAWYVGDVTVTEP